MKPIVNVDDFQIGKLYLLHVCSEETVLCVNKVGWESKKKLKIQVVLLSLRGLKKGEYFYFLQRDLDYFKVETFQPKDEET